MKLDEAESGVGTANDVPVTVGERVMGCIVDIGEVAETEIVVATGTTVENGAVGVGTGGTGGLLINATSTEPISPMIATAIDTIHAPDSLPFEVVLGLRLPERIRTFFMW